MASLREIKERIGSVKSTLKITSAMKLVASAKLRKAQQMVEGMTPYQRTIAEILAAATADETSQAGRAAEIIFSDGAEKTNSSRRSSRLAQSRVAVVTIASNSSLCGAFNANVIRKTKEVLAELGPDVDVYAIGRKIAEPMRKAGYPNIDDYSKLVAHPSYADACELSQTLIDAYNMGLYSKVILVYNHFVSTSKQEVVVETYLPFGLQNEAFLSTEGEKSESGSQNGPVLLTDYILEPSGEAIVETLLPQVMRLKIYNMILDSVASEHAARTVAMQAATDNGEDLLQDLSLEYNKGRQSKITSEILDLVGGSQQ